MNSLRKVNMCLGVRRYNLHFFLKDKKDTVVKQEFWSRVLNFILIFCEYG